MSYISRSANRFYAAAETVYGTAATIVAENRFIAKGLQVGQISPVSRRRDKTGSRTYSPASVGGLKTTAYQISTYLTSSPIAGSTPCAVLFAAGCGGPGFASSGLTVAGVTSSTSIATATPHGLMTGSAVSAAGEIRFVTRVPSLTAVEVNAPFSTTPRAGASLAPTTSFQLGTELNGVTLYDYWDPADAVSRIVTGAVVDTIEIQVSGDQHDITFSGRAADLLDSASFTSGNGGLETFPIEPTRASFSYSIVPGQLGQAWIGNAAQRFFTVTEAQIRLENRTVLRDADVGSGQARAITPGVRQVSASFTICAQDDDQTTSLYQVAKQHGTLSVMLQLGQQNGQIMGVFLPSVRPPIPVFDDSSERLAWQFNNGVAGGLNDDELYIAFA